jgi:hypothetical protein
VALVRERTIPTERPPLVGEVSANFLWIESVAWAAQRIPTVVNLGFIDRNIYIYIYMSVSDNHVHCILTAKVISYKNRRYGIAK